MSEGRRTVSLVYQGYEWFCPNCDTWNQDDCLMPDNQVQCGTCKEIFTGVPHMSPEIGEVI